MKQSIGPLLLFVESGFDTACYDHDRNNVPLEVKQQSIPKIKLLHNLGCLKARSDLECSNLASNKLEHWRICKDSKHFPMIICQFCPFCVKFFHSVCLLNTGLEHSRSNLVFEIRNNFIFGMLY